MYNLKQEYDNYTEEDFLVWKLLYQRQSVLLQNTEDYYGKILFITTITNIIAVAIENKRLFKKQIKQERLNREMELAISQQNSEIF